MEKVAVLGLGKVGTFACELQHDAGFAVQANDLRAPVDRFAFPVQDLDVADTSAVERVLSQVDAVLSCLAVPSEPGAGQGGVCG